MKELLKTYYSEQRHNLEESIARADEKDNMKTIHQLRLSIKKIRALYSFVWYIHPKKKTGKKSLNKLKRIYKPAGDIRDTQVHLEIIENYKKRLLIDFKDYTDFYQNYEREKLNELKFQIQYFDNQPLNKLEKKLNKVLDNISEKELKSKSKQVFEDKLEIIRELNKIPTNKDKNLHQIRKYLKEARYLISIFNGNTSESETFKISLDRLKQIEQTVGKWHDQVNALLFTNYYLSNSKKLSKAETERVEILETSIKKYKSLLLRRIKLAFKHELDIH